MNAYKAGSIETIRWLAGLARYRRSANDPATFYLVSDARVIPREEQDRVACLYRERCAGN
jgi:hypothetical protein